MTRSLVVNEGNEVEIPDWVNDLESFRRWTDDDGFPEFGQISFLRGLVWIDMSKEQVITHTEVKSEINTVLRTLARAGRLGRYLHDGVYVSHEDADVANQPDGVFVSTTAVREKRARLIEGRSEGLVEIEGTPDMVLEVVSRSSVTKDTVTLRAAYAAAGISEYWMVNARSSPVSFELLVLSGGAYRAAKKRAGWQHSPTFGRWFRVGFHDGDDSHPEFLLQHRTERP